MVTVYSLPNCVQCNATTRQMDKLGIEYHVESASEHMENLKSRGYQTAPVVRFKSGDHEDWWSGFNPDKIRQLTAVLV